MATNRRICSLILVVNGLIKSIAYKPIASRFVNHERELPDFSFAELKKLIYPLLGCVRLTRFRNRSTYIHLKKSLKRGFWSYWDTKSLLNHHVPAKVCRSVLPNLLKSYFAYSYSGTRSIEHNLRLFLLSR